MVNVRAVANRACSGVNPNVLASVRICTGYTLGAGYKSTASYADPVDRVVQVQALSKADVKHLDSLDISNAKVACYANMQLTPADRKKQSGGDLVTFTDPSDGSRNVWLVVAVLEGWTTVGWSRVALCKQID